MSSIFERMSARAIRIIGDSTVVTESGDIFTGIFKNEYIETLDIAGTFPVLTCDTSNVSELKRDDLLEIDGKTYKFIQGEPSDAGASRVLLKAASDA